MCLNPLKIYNKSYLRLGGPKYLEVPCGHCPECSNVKQMDYLVRVFATFNELCPINKPTNWSCWFVTFTFDEENIPKSRTATLTDYTQDEFRLLCCLNRFPVGHFRVFGNKIYEISNNYRYCFDHRIMQRFMKNYAQYFRRLGLEEPHMLITSEFGSQRGRPHYHGIIFVNKLYSSWIEFRDEINRFWHYGFTYNARLSKIDGITNTRNYDTAIKYTLKYITKNDMVLPEYLNHGDKCILHDVPDRCYTPRIFTTNDFGAPLERLLTHDNYVLNKVTICVPKNEHETEYKTYNVPSYYRRRYFQKSHIVESSIITKPTYWNGYKKFVQRRQVVEYKHDFEAIRKETFASKFRNEYQTATLVHQSSISENEYVNYRFRQVEYDSPNISGVVWCYKMIDPDPLNDRRVTLDMIKNKDFVAKVSKKVVYLHSSNGNIVNDGILFNAPVLDSKHLFSLVSDLHDVQSRSLLRRQRNYDYKKVDEQRFYEEHNIECVE